MEIDTNALKVSFELSQTFQMWVLGGGGDGDRVRGDLVCTCSDFRYRLICAQCDNLPAPELCRLDFWEAALMMTLEPLCFR